MSCQYKYMCLSVVMYLHLDIQNPSTGSRPSEEENRPLNRNINISTRLHVRVTNRNGQYSAYFCQPTMMSSVYLFQTDKYIIAFFYYRVNITPQTGVPFQKRVKIQVYAISSISCFLNILYFNARKYMHAETIAWPLLTKPLYFPNMKYFKVVVMVTR